MEQKTIGKLIAALRKANGMTQKDLAEKLNVSDKTVSRWERDDGAPDLATIPVLAEIFGITCDELLRGEVRPAAERSDIPAAGSPRAEKQRQRILTAGLSRFRAQSLLSTGLSLMGLIAAMICNLGFLRAYIGFFLGCVFFVTGAVCQAIFINSALLSVSDDELSAQDTAVFRLRVIRLTILSLSITVVLFSATLPLLLYTHDAYVGLTAGSWLSTGLIFSAAALVLCLIAAFFIFGALVRRGFMDADEKRKLAFLYNHRLQRVLALVLAGLFVVTSFAHSWVHTRWDAWALAEGTEFYDYESLVQYMEQDVRYDYTGSFVVAAPSSEPGSGETYDEALREELIIPDGTENGKVVCSYIHRNQNVMSVRPSDTTDGLPVTVITRQDYTSAQIRANFLRSIFKVTYVVEAVAILVIYMKKRAK